MASIFNYDWFHGAAFARQKQQARERVMLKKFPQVGPEAAGNHAEYQKFLAELDTRTLIYLRDGFSYELKAIVEVGLHNNLLTFECEPVDEQYKVGSFIVTVPFDEIVRIEVYAVHPSERPENVPLITGFRTSPADVMSPPPREEPRE